MLYVNRLQELETARKVKKVANSIVQAVIEGLDYGFTECRYYKNATRLGYLSIEGELNNCDLHMNDDYYLQVIDQVKDYFSKYEDVKIVRDTDEHGEFVEVQRVEI